MTDTVVTTLIMSCSISFDAVKLNSIRVQGLNPSNVNVLFTTEVAFGVESRTTELPGLGNFTDTVVDPVLTAVGSGGAVIYQYWKHVNHVHV